MLFVCGPAVLRSEICIVPASLLHYQIIERNEARWAGLKKDALRLRTCGPPLRDLYCSRFFTTLPNHRAERSPQDWIEKRCSSSADLRSSAQRFVLFPLLYSITKSSSGTKPAGLSADEMLSTSPCLPLTSSGCKKYGRMFSNSPAADILFANPLWSTPQRGSIPSTRPLTSPWQSSAGT